MNDGCGAETGRVIIRAMAEEDLDEVCRIEEENFSRPWFRHDFEGSIERSDAVFLTALIVSDISGNDPSRTVAGYIGFYGVPDEGDITNVSVKREFRNRGIGKMLLSELISRTFSAGFRKIFLEVRRSNNAAIGLYERAGFRQVGVRRGYYDAPVEDALIMMLYEEEKDNVFTGF